MQDTAKRLPRPACPPAAAVRRTTVVAEPPPPTPSGKKAKNKTNKSNVTRSVPPPLSNELAMTALMRAMHMVVNSPKASPRTRQRSLSGELTPEGYQTMIQTLLSPTGALYVPSALAMLARTKAVEAHSIEAMGDLETQVMLLVVELENERDNAQRRGLLDQAERGGYTGLPSPVARQPTLPPEPEPEPEPPRSMYCGVCMDNVAIEDIFFVSGCEHTYCREDIHDYVMGCINEQNVMPKCPHDGCQTIISDGDLTMVLTIEEQENYYKTCRDIAIANEPGLFQCLQDNCPGIGALPQDDPHFVCPVCRAERCVQCNTREWHAGVTCEQRRQRDKDSELHPEQLRQIYGNSNVYQCGRYSYGPIEHAYCSNLATHQNEAVGATRIHNGCPRCQWFANDISQWPRWNGQLHAAPALAPA